MTAGGKKAAMTAVYSAAHFMEDMVCAYIIFGLCLGSGNAPVNMLIYNFCAFALQMPMGIIADRADKNGIFSAAGCGLTALSCIFGELFGGGAFIAAAAGIGNAAFHVGGGTDVLGFGKSSSAAGIFVSPGAIGLYIGTLLGKSSHGLGILPGVMIGLTAVFIVFIRGRLFGRQDSKGIAFEILSLDEYHVPKLLYGAAGMIFAVVCVRSFLGFGVSFPWKTGTAAAMAVCASALGKACGGIISDRTGRTAAVVISSFGGAVMFLLGDNMICGLLALWLFNMSMPLTLRGAADIFRNGRGFSFGLLTFALFIGFIPIYASNGGISLSGIGSGALSAASGIMLIVSFAIMKRGGAVEYRGNAAVNDNITGGNDSI